MYWIYTLYGYVDNINDKKKMYTRENVSRIKPPNRFTICYWIRNYYLSIGKQKLIRYRTESNIWLTQAADSENFENLLMQIKFYAFKS